MKYLKNFLFLTIFIFLNLHSDSSILNQAFIDKKALEIEKKMKQDRYIMYGLTGMAIAYGVYQWMPVLITCASPKSTLPVTIENTTDAGEKQKPIEKLSMTQSLKKAMHGVKDGTCEVFHDLFCTKESWLSFFQYTISLTGAGIINQVTEKFMHPDTLRWYIHNHAPYYMTVKMMKERIADLQDPLLDAEQYRVHDKMLSLLYNRLVRQAHFMCAYIDYKINYIEGAEKTIGKQVQQSIIKIHTQLLADIRQKLNFQEDPDFNAAEMHDVNLFLLDQCLDKYHNALDAQINHFALTEGETKKERAAAIKKK